MTNHRTELLHEIITIIKINYFVVPNLLTSAVHFCKSLDLCTVHLHFELLKSEWLTIMDTATGTMTTIMQRTLLFCTGIRPVGG